MSAWETARNDLGALGKVTRGRDAIPEQVLNAFRAEDDFHDAFVFEGEYRALMSTLAKHELRIEGLIEPMSRENTTQSMMQAFALASTDVVEFAKDEADLARAIYVQVVNLYAVSPEWRELHRWCEEFAAIIANLSPEQCAELSGPIWLREQVFETEQRKAIAKHKWLPVIISAHQTMCLRR